MPDFDPYHRWLGITPDEQPPTPHRLLGIAPDETDKETIRRAALQRNAFIRQFSIGEQGKIAERLLNEIAAARDVILAAIKQPAVETPSPVETPFEPDEENTDPAVAPTAQAPNSIPQEPVIPAIHIAVENSHTQLDAYYEWLGILPDEQPASHYRLLAIQEFESNASIINDAAERRFILLRQFQPGPDAELAEDLLNEVARARNCLLDVHSKAKYDQQLKDI